MKIRNVSVLDNKSMGSAHSKDKTLCRDLWHTEWPWLLNDHVYLAWFCQAQMQNGVSIYIWSKNINILHLTVIVHSYFQFWDSIWNISHNLIHLILNQILILTDYLCWKKIKVNSSYFCFLRKSTVKKKVI